MGFLGKIGDVIGKIAKVAAPIVSAINPLAGAAIGLAGNLASGKNPLQALLGAAGDMIPGGGVLKNVLGAFGGAGGLLEGAGGNSLLSGALNLATGKGGITDVLKGFLGGGQASAQGTANAGELAAQAMSKLLGGFLGG